MKLTINSIYLIFALFFFVECNKSGEGKIVSEEKFVDVLVDIHFADAIMSDKGLYDGNLKDSTKSYYNYVLKKHSISRATFDKSMKYYSQNGEVYLKIYDKVIARISEQVPVKLCKESIYNIINKALEASEKVKVKK